MSFSGRPRTLVPIHQENPAPKYMHGKVAENTASCHQQCRTEISQLHHVCSDCAHYVASGCEYSSHKHRCSVLGSIHGLSVGPSRNIHDFVHSSHHAQHNPDVVIRRDTSRDYFCFFSRPGLQPLRAYPHSASIAADIHPSTSYKLS